MKNSILQDIDHFIAQRRISAALDMVANQALGLGLSLEIDRIERVKGDYALMTRYALDGINDPGREEVYASIVAAIRDIAVSIERSRSIDSAPTLYFNTLRYERMQRGDSVAVLMSRYRVLNERINMAALAENPESAAATLRREAEALEKRLFNLVWITYPLSVDDSGLIASVFEDKALPEYFKILILSAILLGQLHYHDERRLMLLMDIYASPESGEQLEVYALCGLLLSMWSSRNRPLTRRVANRFAALTELPRWNTDVRMALMQFIRTRDTDRINRKINDEVIPRMMELGPDLRKVMGDISSIESISPEENPEWEDILKKSGIADRMKELQEMQEEGADVMMATFGKLKTFSFFNEISNWFLPFHVSHSSVIEAVGNSVEGELLARTVAESPVFCNSDKYSVILSIAQMPQAQRSMLMSQLSGYTAHIAEAISGASKSGTRESLANTYVKDLYRFFKLFRRSGEFPNPFEMPVNLIMHPLLADVFDDVDTLSLVGEFYFKRQYFDDAFEIFDKLSYKMPPSAQLFQKMGYCRQSCGDMAGALKFYEQSELLNADSRWTMRRIAACHRALGNHIAALPYFKRLAEQKPDDVSAAMNLGNTYLSLKQYDEALAQYYKVEFLDEKSRKALRPLAWCNLIMGNSDRAQRYYDEIMSLSPTATDYINAGHLEMISRQYHKAVDRYVSAIAAMDFDKERFVDMFNEDVAMLEKAGIDTFMRSLVIDEVLSKASSMGEPLKK